MHLKYTFFVDADRRDVLLALLQNLPFQAFEEVEDGLITGVDSEEVTDDFVEQLRSFQQIVAFDYVKQKMDDENWNAVWEATFREILIDDFCQIRAPFHPKRDDVSHTIMIEPRMAFGTGHHETTRLMIRAMRDLDICNLQVGDFGSGTGILAILALKLGAGGVKAIECDPVAFENLLENTILNHADAISCLLGDNLSSMEDEALDVLLVNITRNTLLHHLPEFARVLKVGGYLLLAGFLEHDMEVIVKRAHDYRFSLQNHYGENDWLSLTLIKE